jgi:hypothetical protein
MPYNYNKTRNVLLPGIMGSVGLMESLPCVHIKVVIIP